MTTQTASRHFTLEEYVIVRERIDVKIELLDGQIWPKESAAPLPTAIVEEILRPNFNPNILNYEFPMATTAHADIIRNLNYGLIRQLDEEQFLVYTQDPKIYISLSGRYRLPDITVAPGLARQDFQNDCLTNPLIIIEVLSSSNSGAAFMEKIHDYKSIETLQEYWLVAQDKPSLERYVRYNAEEWLSRSFDTRHPEITFPTLSLSMKLDAVYRGVFEE